MSKKYSDDEYGWDDEYEWDERYDEFDDSFDDVEDEDYPRKKKSSTAKKGSASKSGSVKSGSTKSGSSKSGTAKSGAAKSGAAKSSSAKSSSSKSGSASGSAGKSAGAKSGSAKSSGTKNGTAKSGTAAKKSTSAKKTSKKKSSRRKKKRIALMVVVCLLEVVLLVAVLGGLWVMSKLGQIQKPSGSENINFGAGGDVEVNELDSGVIETMKGYTTFAVFGLDKRSMASLNDGQSDVILLVSVNNDTGEISMASVYRDTYLEISEGKFFKVNAAYNQGGPVQAIQALNTNLDLQIDHYVSVNWYAVAQTIDLMGGVDINVEEKLFYAQIPAEQGGGYWLNSYIEMTAQALQVPVTYVPGPGYQTLNGLQAVALCRIRQVGSDMGRTSNQRQVVSQMFEKAKTTGLATLIEIADNVFPNVATDLTYNEMYTLLGGLGKYYLNESVGFPFEMTSKTIDGHYSLIAKDLISNVAELHRILYGNEQYVPSDTVIHLSEMISQSTGIFAD